MAEGWAPRTCAGRAALVAGLTFWSGLLPAQPPPRITAGAAQQIAVLKGLKTAKTAAQSKIDSRLFLGLLHLRHDARLAALPDFRFVQPEADGRVPVDIVVADAAGVKAVVHKVESLGAVIRDMSYVHRRVSTRVRLEDLEPLAALPEVRKIRQLMPAINRAINVSEGDKTHGANLARSILGINGAFIKICVLSDGVSSLAALQASGDLPAVDVLPGQDGFGDEGSAMLEIIHDLAPGATLGFATATTSEASFAQNILDLAADGCNIMVDDILYLDESPFQDGPVAQAVNTAAAAGVLYFSAAGNEGNKDDLTSGTWEGDFRASAAADPAALAGANLHDFGDGGNSILVESSAFDPPLLIWAEHYDLATGSASTDFDLYDMDAGLTTIFDASTDVQDGLGGDDFPIEFIGGGALSGERLLIDRFAAGTTSSVPMMNLIVIAGELDDNLATSGATRGHSAAADAFSVAATPAAASFDGITPDGPYPGLFTAANASESFTSDGPRRILLSPGGAEITPGNRTSTGGVVRQKPDLTAADGVSTAAPGFNPFYGTSAAAPHAAALAALAAGLSDIFPYTPAIFRGELSSWTLDIEAPGIDRDTGLGIPMATRLSAQTGPFLNAGVVTSTQAAGDGDAFIENGETWLLTIPLANQGVFLPATAITATLTTSTPGVTILAGSSAYPDLASGASSNNLTPYSFSVGAGVPCGDSIDFTLTVNFLIGPPRIIHFTLGTGSPGTPLTFSYTGPAVPIPDGNDSSGTAPGAPAAAGLPVAGVPGNIFDVDLRIDGTSCSAADGATTVGLDHTFVQDLELTLISPTGTQALVINNADGSGNNFCQTRLDDEAGGSSIQSVVTAQAPFTGSFKPNAPLSAFDGENGNGTWQLRAQDLFSQDAGNLRAFTVIITPAVCSSSPQGAQVTATKTASGTFKPGGTVTYTVTLTNNGNAPQQDNPGNEFTDILPNGLTLIGATATAPTVVADIPNKTVTWNGTLPADGGTVTLSITAVVNSGTGGQTLSNQGTCSYDSNSDNTNETVCITDNPATAAPGDPTSVVIGQSPVEIPTLSALGLAVLFAALAGAAMLLLHYRASGSRAKTLSTMRSQSGPLKR